MVNKCVCTEFDQMQDVKNDSNAVIKIWLCSEDRKEKI